MERTGLKELQGFVNWLESLRIVPEDLWLTPIAQGKWAIQGIVSHIMLWDKYFLENAIEPIVNHRPITIAETFDFDDFNKNAVEYGKKRSKEELIAQGMDYRSQTVHHITNMSDEEYVKEYPNFQMAQYVIDFVEHDNHHKAQIEVFLHSH